MNPSLFVFVLWHSVASSLPFTSILLGWELCNINWKRRESFVWKNGSLFVTYLYKVPGWIESGLCCWFWARSVAALSPALVSDTTVCPWSWQRPVEQMTLSMYFTRLRCVYVYGKLWKAESTCAQAEPVCCEALVNLLQHWRWGGADRCGAGP